MFSKKAQRKTEKVTHDYLSIYECNRNGKKIIEINVFIICFVKKKAFRTLFCAIWNDKYSVNSIIYSNFLKKMIFYRIR